MPAKIIIVLTSHDRLGDTGEPTGFWLEEFAAPYYAFTDAGMEVTLSSPHGGQPPVDPRSEADEAMTEITRRFMADAVAQRRLRASVSLSEIDPDDYDAVFYPGGHGPLWDLVANEHSIALLRSFSAKGKPIGAVCHGPVVLLNAVRGDGRPLVEGRRLTGFTDAEEAAIGLTEAVPLALETALVERGARFEKRPPFTPFALADGLIVTGQNPMSSEMAAEAMIRLLDRRLAA
ncbi:MAG: type 1 glutamine amidotransferase domain-containing protein [Pseudomonadota bacterium]